MEMASPLTDVCIVAKFREVRIKGYAMIGQVVQLISKGVQLHLDKLKFFIDISMFAAEVAPPLFMMRMDLANSIKL